MIGDAAAPAGPPAPTDAEARDPDRVPLGQVLKVIQRERARVAIRLLRDAGYREVDDLTAHE